MGRVGARESIMSMRCPHKDINTYVCVCVLTFRYGGALQNIAVKLPVMLNKFFQPTEMMSQDFFQRWKQLGA